jgi:formate--tetrahydrofolate ligase
VLVATIRSLKMQGGAPRTPSPPRTSTHWSSASPTSQHHVRNVQQFGVPVVVAINRFLTDTPAEIAMVTEYAERIGVRVAYTDVWAEGGAGGEELAREVLALLAGGTANFAPIYDAALPIRTKAETSRKVYGADGVDFTPRLADQIDYLESIGMGDTPVCMAKTQYSLTDDATRLGTPQGFRITVNEVWGSAGAGFVVCKTGDIMTMPGLSKVPAAEGMQISREGVIEGLS